MKVPRLHREVSIFDPDNTIDGGIEDARGKAENYITDISEDGIWVHPQGQGPDSNGDPVSTAPAQGEDDHRTYGWHISDVLEYFKAGASYFKLWMNTALNRMQMRLGPANSGHAVIDSTGMEVLTDASTSVAKFGEEVRIGHNAHVDIDFNGMAMTDKDGDAFMSASDLRGSDGRADFTETFAFSSDGKYILAHPASSVTSVKVDGSNAQYTSSSFVYTVGSLSYVTTRVSVTNPTSGNTVTVTYKTDSETAKAFSFGMDITGNVGGCGSTFGIGSKAVGLASTSEGIAAKSGGWGAHSEGIGANAVGSASHAEGMSTTAGGANSHAEGKSSSSDGENSHAEGEECTAQGIDSHAEGYGSVAEEDIAHAEGFMATASGYASHCEGEECTASGTGAHAEGRGTTASGSASHAGGLSTKASGDNQTVVGKYNVEDTSGTYAFIVGKGTANNARSNAFLVSWAGNAWVSGTLTQASDARLKEHVSYLSDDAVRFVRDLGPALYRKDGDHVGFYAQDVRDADPWGALVEEGPDGYLSLDYQGLVAPLVAYCQHLERRIEALEGGE